MDESARLRKLLKKPLQTEKVIYLQENEGIYTFEVTRNANKIEIKRAIEHLFDVEVVNVRTITVRGKLIRQGRYVGRRPTRKKALVTLANDETLDLYENV